MPETKCKVGDKVRPVTVLDHEGFIVPMMDYTIAITTTDKIGRLNNIGIVSEKYIEGWGSLNGRCEEGYGLWVTMNFFTKHFKINSSTRRALIKDEFIFRRKDLKGKVGNMISQLPGSELFFVEFDENLGGCSADGLGKAGRCVMIPKKHIKIVK